ncbi:hypothetical protein HID58_070521 [Brassica napus]|uniref:Uncharacterized protein n=1 Tax=Brassica napus TaxID=3708 RepID=A0ABQ7YZ10_BRANA|nr:hypothetical protein HID58_070521 [Brassica napus]
MNFPQSRIKTQIMLNRDDPKAKEDSSSNVGGEETAMDEANPSTIDKSVSPETEQSPRDADESEENASEKEMESSDKEEEKESSEVEEDNEGEKEVGEEEKEAGDEEKEVGEEEKEPRKKRRSWPKKEMKWSPEEMTKKLIKGRSNQYENMKRMQRRLKVPPFLLLEEDPIMQNLDRLMHIRWRLLELRL